MLLITSSANAAVFGNFCPVKNLERKPDVNELNAYYLQNASVIAHLRLKSEIDAKQRYRVSAIAMAARLPG